MKTKLSKEQKGFTIIEVLIVLAIAGLIILIVFLAVPSLQRNNRNTQRKNDTSNIAGALQESINNSNTGTLPTQANVTHTMGGAATAIPDAVENITRTQLLNINYTWVATGVAAALPATITPDTIVVRNNLKCNSGTTAVAPYVDPGTNTTTIATTIATPGTAASIATTTGATPRTAVLIYGIERQGGFVGQCQDI